MAAESSPATQTKRLGEMLLEAGVITEGQLNEALKTKETEGGFIGKILMDMKFIDEHTLTNFLVKQFKIPHISLLDYEIAPEVASMVPQELCVEYNLIPVDKLGKILTIAMVDPLDTHALEKVREACPEVRIKPILCSFQHFEHVLRKAYSDANKPKEKPDAPEKSQEELTMESFGLTAKSDKGRKKPAPKTAEPASESSPMLPPSADEILAAVDKSVQAGIAQALEHLSNQVRDYVTAGNGTLPVTSLQLAERVRTAISESAELAGGAVVQDVKKALNDAQTPASDLNALQLGQVLEISMRRALSRVSTEILEEAARALADRKKR